MQVQRKRIAALLLAGAMLFSTLPVNALAVENPDTGGLCEHHPEHTSECGYTEGTEGMPCQHEHTEDCYALLKNCVHEHTDECYPQESVSDNVDTPPDAEQAEPVCAHVCSEESGCIVEQLDCQHEHSEDCGYTEAVPGTPCTFVCEKCNAETDQPEQPQQITITEFDPLDEDIANQIVTPGEKLNLPDTLGASGYIRTQDSGGAEHLTIEGVTWEPDQPYDENAEQGTWLFTAVLPENYTRLDGVELPEISVLAEPVNLLANKDSYDINKGSVTIDNSCGNSCFGHTISGTSTTNTITVTGGSHDIILNGVNIDVSNIDDTCAFEITGNATINLTLTGDNILKSGLYKAGLNLPDDAKLTIIKESLGKLEVTGGAFGAGIGGNGSRFGNAVDEVGTIVINGGNIIAHGGSCAAGIGGGNGGDGGEIIITGGNVTATAPGSNGDPAAIGGGGRGNAGTIVIKGGVVTADGCDKGIGGGIYETEGSITIQGGIVTANGIGTTQASGSITTKIDGGIVICGGHGVNKDQQASWNGIIFDGNDKKGQVYGNTTLTDDFKIQDDTILDIPSGSTLTIDKGITVTVNGKITNNEKMINNGHIDGNGTLEGPGTLTGTGTIADTINNKFLKASEIKVSVKGTDVTGSDGNYSAPYNTTLSISANVSQATTNALTRAGANEVSFYLGTVDSGKPLGTAKVDNNGTATLQNITITTDNGWKVNTYQITAEYGGSMTLTPKTGTATLAVTKADQTPPAQPTIQGKVTTNSVTLNEITTPGQGDVEYGYVDGSSGTPQTWYSSPIFDGVLTPGKNYTFFARYVGNQFYNPAVSVGTPVYTVPETPAADAVKIIFESETITFDDKTLEVNTALDFAAATNIENNDPITNYIGGTIYVRVKQSGNIPASGKQTVPIPDRTAAQPTVEIDYTAETLSTKTTMEYGIATPGQSVQKWESCSDDMAATAFGNWKGSTPVTVHFRIPATSTTFASVEQTVTIPARPTTAPIVKIDYAAETLSTSKDMQYGFATPGQSVQNWQDCSEKMKAVDLGWGGLTPVEVHFRFKADPEKPSFASVEQTVTIPARPAAPTGFQGKNETAENKEDGQIIDLQPNTAYDLSSDGGVSWKPVPSDKNGFISGLAKGDYQIRFAAVADQSFASPKADVVIGTDTYTLNVSNLAFDPAPYGTQPEAKKITISSAGNRDAKIIRVTANSDFEIGGSGKTVKAGGSIDTWTIRPVSGLGAGEHKATITVTYEGNEEYQATAQVSFTVTPAEQAAPDKAPELDRADTSSITLKALAPNGNGAAAEYSRDGGASWQDSPIFESLSSGTKYSFVVRYGATADGNYSPSPASPAADHSTERSYSGGGGSSSNGNSTVTDRPDKNDPDSPTTGQTKPVKPDKGGNVTINSGDVQDAINKATADANKNGNQKSGIAVTVPVNNAADMEGLTITIPAATLDKLVTAKVRRFDITTNGLPRFSFTLDTLQMLDKQSQGGNLILRLTKTAVTSVEAKAAIGTRPAYDITLVWMKGGKETPLTDWQGQTISVKLPYTPAKGEQAGNLYAVSVDASGKVEWLTKSSYDADQKAVLFEATHFSVYGVSYKLPAPVFNDISGHWAEEHILFVASRGLLNGTGNGQFSPNTGMTRGMFVTALGRLAGIDPASYQTGKFNDVAATAYYAPYVNWAAQTGIVNGTTETTFSPDSRITREQMAVMMKNYADKLGYELPATLEAVTFADDANISAWAKSAVKAMQQAGILAGKDGNRFDPKGTATRAEVATVLHRFVEIVIDPQAANGWTENASGTRAYYKGGKPAIGWLYDDKWYWLESGGIPFAGGWKQIGGKWYFFNPDGTMAVNTTIDGYQIGPDGARK